MRNVKNVVGHVDIIDADGVSGWAVGPKSQPHITLFVDGKPRDVMTERRKRPDVAAEYGPSAAEAGFFIPLKDIAPKNPDELADFLASIEVRADGRRLRLSAQARAHGKRATPLARAIRTIGWAFGIAPRDRNAKAEQKKYFAEPARLAALHGRDLQPFHIATAKIKPKDILVFVTARNEMPRIPYFLDYYRKMGVGHFLFVDNDSTDGLSDYLKKQPDCSVWRTSASYKASNFGVHWLNHLAHQYGVGHWCLTLDPDEFLVFPFCEERNLHELVEFLELEEHDHLFCVLLDMYSNQRVSETICHVGQNPLEVAPYFDGVGYVQRENASYGETYVQGGPRRRIFFREQPKKAPAINKTPLVKWGPNYNYLSSTHMLAPKAANHPHASDRMSPTGCLLHFKFLSLMAEKAAEEVVRKEHYDDSIEYKNYHAVISSSQDHMFFEKSVKFESSRQLCELGFMSPGQWF